MTAYSELKRLADRVISDRRFCGDENHKALAEGVMALIAEIEALRKAALAAREFIMHEAEVRGLLDENNEVSFRHPRRRAVVAALDAAMAKGEQP